MLKPARFQKKDLEMGDQGTEGLLSPYLRSQRLKAVSPYIRGRVLDVGCGTGQLALRVPPDQYLGVDADEASLVLARQKNPRHFFQASMPETKSKFDTVTALAVIEHLAEPVVFLQKLAGYLREGSESFIVLTTPHPFSRWIHKAGKATGLFSRQADMEHKDFLGRDRIRKLAQECRLDLVSYRPFLFGTNQLVVFRIQQNDETCGRSF